MFENHIAITRLEAAWTLKVSRSSSQHAKMGRSFVDFHYLLIKKVRTLTKKSALFY